MAKKSASRTSSRARPAKVRASALKAGGKARPGVRSPIGSDQLPVAVSHGFPVPAHPYYHLRLAFSLEGADPYQVRRVKVNGQRVRDFETFHDFRFVNNQVLKPGGHGELYVRWDWKPRSRSTPWRSRPREAPRATARWP